MQIFKKGIEIESMYIHAELKRYAWYAWLLDRNEKKRLKDRLQIVSVLIIVQTLPRHCPLHVREMIDRDLALSPLPRKFSKIGTKFFPRVVKPRPRAIIWYHKSRTQVKGLMLPSWEEHSRQGPGQKSTPGLPGWPFRGQIWALFKTFGLEIFYIIY